MESNKNTQPIPHIPEESKQPLTLIAQLMKSATSMHHMDEVFLWLANTMVQQWNIPIVQFWANRTIAKQVRSEMRAASCFDASLLRQTKVNIEVAAILERVIQEQQDFMILPTTSAFTPQSASLLAQYGLYYWGGYILRQSISLPLIEDRLAIDKTATSFNIIVAIFTQQPPSQKTWRDISFLTQQGLRIAKSCGFLASPPPSPASTVRPETRPVTIPTQAAQLTLGDLIPTRADNVQALQISNPPGNTAIITNSAARLLYAAIDGKKDLAELAHQTNIEPREILKALHYLLMQGRIRFHKPGGEIVESASLLPYLV